MKHEVIDLLDRRIELIFVFTTQFITVIVMGTMLPHTTTFFSLRKKELVKIICRH